MNKLYLALLMVLTVTVSAYATDVRIGTGSTKGNYQKACVQTQIQTKGSAVNVQCIPGKGTLENIRKIQGGELDGAFVQPDGLVGDVNFQYEIVATYHNEFVHAITLADSKLGSIKDLDPKKDTIAIGANGGGTAITWANFTKQDKAYAKIATLPLAGSRALSALESGKVTVVLRTCGLRDAEIMRANAQKGKFKLISVDDWDFNDKIKGQELYTFDKIDDDVYPNLIAGMFNGSIESIRMGTRLIVKSDWADENSGAFDDLYDGAAKAVPNVLKMVVND